MENSEAVLLMQQINYFNENFHESEDQPYLKEFHELMRASKNRCQLMLLKFASPDIVWIKKDLSQPHHEWLIGLHELSDSYAFHIPLSVLKQGLSEAQLAIWNIQ